MFNEQILSVNTTSQVSLTAVDEIYTIVTDMEADHITSQNSLKNFIWPWKQTENIPWRKWNMQKKRQLELQSLFFSHFTNVIGAKHQMIIVDPDNWNSSFFFISGATFNSRNRLISKKFICCDIGTPVIGAENGTTYWVTVFLLLFLCLLLE